MLSSQRCQVGDHVARHASHAKPASRRDASRKGTRRVGALDGLRVLSMLAIVVYHANVNWLPGGFLGVTAFFTLSGYLITDALLREVKRSGGPIDVLGFYARRLRRLVPLMVCVVACTAILSAIFAPGLLAKMRPDTIPALLFFENVWFIVREQSYFAASGLPSPITHFWFLSVIVQFYLVWPWVVLLLTRTMRSRRSQGHVVAALAIASAILAAVLYNPTGDPSRVYYGTDTRLGEILVGAWLAFAWPTDGLTAGGKAVAERLGGKDRTIVTDLLAVLALCGLGWLCRNLNGYSPLLYRGGLFGVSVLTALVIAAVVRPGSLLALPLGLPPLVEIAKRSFGIYLWHYPLLLIMNPATRTTDLPWWGWALEALAIVVAVEASLRLVEQPWADLLGGSRATPTHGRDEGRRTPVASIALLLLLAVTGGALVYVGPFWYEDGASQQVTDTTSEAPAPEPPAAEKPERTVAESPEQAVSEAAERLEDLLAHKEYPVDPETGSTEAPVILIGDSVPAGAVDQFYAVFPNGYIDAVVGRQLYEGDDVYLYDQSVGYDQRIVVFSVGDNGVASEEDVVDLIESAGSRQVYLVTTRVPLPLQDMNNALFFEVAERYDNVEVIDWYAWSEGHDEFFWDDGTHLRPEGAEAYVQMLRYYICGE